MKLRSKVLLAALAIMGCATTPATHAQSQSQAPKPTAVLFENVRIFNGASDRLSAPQNVLVVGNVIRTISTAPIAPPPEIAMMRKAIDRTGRPIVLSLSPGETPIERAAHVTAHANLWRISGDFWDLWKLLDRQFELIRLWQPHAGPGHWPDADMLPLGKLRISPDDYVAEQMGLTMKEITNEHSRFTDPEKVTLMTLWSIFRSPLMMGGHLPENDDLTLQLLTNEEVLAVNLASARNREVLAEGTAVAWAADSPDGGTYVNLLP